MASSALSNVSTEYRSNYTPATVREDGIEAPFVEGASAEPQIEPWLLFFEEGVDQLAGVLQQVT
jgi:hypothetical protein